jgi:hypothetical protein
MAFAERWNWRGIGVDVNVAITKKGKEEGRLLSFLVFFWGSSLIFGSSSLEFGGP